MGDIDSILGPLTLITDAIVSVDNNRLDHALTLHISAHGAEGKRLRIDVAVPATHVPGLMREIVNHGGNLLTEIADEWRMGDCPTCRNIRMVDEPAPGGRTQRVHCPDCGPSSRDAALHGYPIPHREGEPSTAV